MNKKDIDREFKAFIAVRGVGKQLELSKQQVWNYRNQETSLGTKLEVLFKLGRIRFKDGWDD
jgi:hypothetical protein